MRRLQARVRNWRSSDRTALRAVSGLARTAKSAVGRVTSLVSQLRSRPGPASGLMADLHDTNPYRGFYRLLARDSQTWGGRKAIFGELVEQVRPTLVIEVGTWKGGSAITMASRMKDLGLDGTVLCVDTWLGSVEHWYAKDDPGRRSYYDSLRLSHGYPQLYEQFVVNVIHAGLEDVVVPFPATSQVAAEWLEWKGVAADLIYIDAGHGEDDVYADLVAYHRLLREGGVLFGDDWQWAGVEAAVKRFSAERSLEYQLVEGDTMFVLSAR